MQEGERYRWALSQLPIEERVVLALRVVRGWSVEEVARHLGIPESGVRSLQLSGLRRAQRLLDTGGVTVRPGSRCAARGLPRRGVAPA